MSEKKIKQWKLIFNQRTYYDGDRYAEGDNEAFLECPYCGKNNHYSIIKEPTECEFCHNKVEGIK